MGGRNGQGHVVVGGPCYPAADMEAFVTLLSLAIVCPACGKRPNIRVFPLARQKHAHDDEPMATLRCRCGEVYVITAKAYRRAS